MNVGALFLMSDSTKNQTLAPEGVDRARRRLLGMALYVPPTILGIVALQQAGCQPSPTCNPATCDPATQPCQPDDNPCAPNTGCNPDTCPPQPP